VGDREIVWFGGELRRGFGRGGKRGVFHRARTEKVRGLGKKKEGGGKGRKRRGTRNWLPEGKTGKGEKGSKGWRHDETPVRSKGENREGRGEKSNSEVTGGNGGRSRREFLTAKGKEGTSK